MSAAPPRWLEVSVVAPAGEEAAWLVVDGLVALGCRGALERDGRVVGYVPDPVDPGAVERELRSHLAASGCAGPLDVAMRWLRHEDWAVTWRAGLVPRRVGRRIVVSPSWERPSLRDGEVLVVVDPGMAFGTAGHGTTRACLRLLESALRGGDHVVDVGAGSGILSVAAARLGAARVTALEMDPFSFQALVENVATNGVGEVVECREERIDAAALRALRPADGVVANLDARALGKLGPGFADALRPGGWLVLSGVLAGEWDDLCAEMQRRGFRVRAVDDDGEWRSGLLEAADT